MAFAAAGVRAWHIIRAMTAVPRPTESASVVPTPAGEQAPASSMKVYARLLGYTRPYLGYFALSVVGFAIAGACKAGLASVLKYFIDGLAAPDAPIATGLAWLDALDLVVAIPLMIVVIALAEGLGTFLGNYGISRVSLGLIHDLRTQLFGSFLVLPNRFYDASNSAKVSPRSRCLATCCG
jgi:subfamily B ATP-binding cassette protein MsbA